MIGEPSICSETFPHPSCDSKSAFLLLLLLTSRSFTRLRPFSLLAYPNIILSALDTWILYVFLLSFLALSHASFYNLSPTESFPM